MSAETIIFDSLSLVYCWMLIFTPKQWKVQKTAVKVIFKAFIFVINACKQWVIHDAAGNPLIQLWSSLCSFSIANASGPTCSLKIQFSPYLNYIFLLYTGDNVNISFSTICIKALRWKSLNSNDVQSRPIVYNDFLICVFASSSVGISRDGCD